MRRTQALRQGDNPARLEGLKGLLPSKTKVAAKEHHAALDYREVGAFMAELRQRQGAAKQALDIHEPHQAARVGETIGARWWESIYRPGYGGFQARE